MIVFDFKQLSDNDLTGNLVVHENLVAGYKAEIERRAKEKAEADSIPEKKPYVGAIVNYVVCPNTRPVPGSNGVIPGVILGANDQGLDIVYLLHASFHTCHYQIPYSKSKKPGTWHWPESEVVS